MSDYEIHENEVLGEGGMGTVCRGRQISLDRPVAIKIIRNDLTDTPNYVERFRREAELLGQVIDGHVVQVFGAGEWKGRHFYAMEYIEGEDLAALLLRGRVFTIEEILRIAHGVASALKAAWRYQIVHRDIKPSNILITADHTVKVADFGLARSLSRAPAHTMTIAGTAKYLSPEQGMGEPVDVRSDIYSLGIVLFELVTRRAPFNGDSPTAVIYNHLHSLPPSVKKLAPTLREDVAALIMKCLEKRPDDRFQTPEELLEAIGRIRAQVDPKGSALMTRPVRPFKPRRAGLVAAGGFAGCLALAAIAYASWSYFSEDPAQREHWRKSVDLALGVGNYDEAMTLAERHFGTDSNEYEKANLAHRSAKVAAYDVRAQAEAAKKNWKEVVKAYEVMLQFADGDRKQHVTLGLAFFRDLALAEEAETAGQWPRALELYQGLQPPSQELRDHVRESVFRVQKELATAKQSAAVLAREQAGLLMQEAQKHRSRASWGPALEQARKARDLVKPYGDIPAEMAALLRELEKAVSAPVGFVFVPAGPFDMGSDQETTVEAPRHKNETGAFYISVQAVTRREYSRFLEDEASRSHKLCPPEEPRDKDHTPADWTKDLPKDEPVTGVDWFDAVAYSRFAGLRLPTETEWEKAAAHQLDEKRSRKYPWGDTNSPEAKDVSFFGAQGMGRGPIEWTQSPFEGYPGSTFTHAGYGKGFRVLRGGVLSPDDYSRISRTGARHWRQPGDRDRRFGFRCAKDVE